MLWRSAGVRVGAAILAVLCAAVSLYAANAYVQVPPDSTGSKIDTESLTVAAQTVMRQRIQVAGTTDTSIAAVVAAIPAAGDFALAVRQVGLPAAAALADNLANPTTSGLASYLFGFDGSTWDRLTATSSALDVNVKSITSGVGALTDTEDGTIADGQSGAVVSIGLLHSWDGDNWTRAGATTHHAIIGASTSATNIKASAGVLYGFLVSNVNASARYMKFYNSASAPTCGSGTPVLRVLIPPSSSGVLASFPTPGVAYTTGIGYCITTGSADNDTGAPSASDVLVNVFYK